jgi:hypothetical protein
MHDGGDAVDDDDDDVEMSALEFDMSLLGKKKTRFFLGNVPILYLFIYLFIYGMSVARTV